MQEVGELCLKCGVLTSLQVRLFQFLDGRHQHFGDVAPAIGTEVPGGIRLLHHAASAALAARRKSIIFRWSLMPGALSMREHASTPQGFASSMARATLPASSPPATIMRLALRPASCQSKVWPAPPYRPAAGPSNSSASAGASS